MKTLKIASLFSGIGAFEQALRKCGAPHEIVVACDNNKFVKKSYFANYNPKNWVDDVRDVKGGNYVGEDIDILVGAALVNRFPPLGCKEGWKIQGGHFFMNMLELSKNCNQRFLYMKMLKEY